MQNKLSHTLIELAIKTASKSTSYYRLGAVIFKGKRIISCGFNRTDINPFVQPITTRMKKFSIHAEHAAILNAHTKIVGCSILVVRINKKLELRLAKPCEKCLYLLNYVGIKNIYFSTSEGNIEKL